METVVVQDWTDPRAAEVHGDCMGRVGAGMYYHHQLNRLLIVRSDMPTGLRNVLPLTPRA